MDAFAERVIEASYGGIFPYGRSKGELLWIMDDMDGSYGLNQGFGAKPLNFPHTSYLLG